MDAEPARMGLTVVLKLSGYFRVQHLHHTGLSSVCINSTDNFTRIDAGNSTLEFMPEVLVEIKALWDFYGSEINLCELLYIQAYIYNTWSIKSTLSRAFSLNIL